MEGLSGRGKAILSMEATLVGAGLKEIFQIAHVAAPKTDPITAISTIHRYRLGQAIFHFFCGGTGGTGSLSDPVNILRFRFNFPFVSQA